MNHSNLDSFQQFAKAADALIDPLKVRVALDVGSRDGEVALYLKQHYPNATVYAFECNPVAIKICHQQLAGHKQVFLVDRAVSDVEGSLDFFAIDPEKTVTPHKDGNIGASSLYEAKTDYPYETYVQKRITVDSITLEAWAQRQGIANIDLIWMDLQGAELRALKGLGHLIQSVKLIYTEVEYKEIYVDQPLAAEVRDFLYTSGFRLYKQFCVSEWFGDELFCPRYLLPWWKRWI
jgi:FkbM family methyltransferase